MKKLSRTQLFKKLEGKTITLVQHADRAGKKATRRWSQQLVTSHSTNLLTFRISSEIKELAMSI